MGLSSLTAAPPCGLASVLQQEKKNSVSEKRLRPPVQTTSGDLVLCLQFSKEKYLLESPPEKLRKELEEELRLSAADIRSHGWYHGHIPREVSPPPQCMMGKLVLSALSFFLEKIFFFCLFVCLAAVPTSCYIQAQI